MSNGLRRIVDQIPPKLPHKYMQQSNNWKHSKIWKIIFKQKKLKSYVIILGCKPHRLQHKTLLVCYNVLLVANPQPEQRCAYNKRAPWEAESFRSIKKILINSSKTFALTSWMMPHTDMMRPQSDNLGPQSFIWTQ